MSDIKKDMHIHSCFSDGDLRPEEIVDRWEAEGYKLIAITDHDGIDGSIIACNYCRGKSIVVVPGIEFDSDDELGSKLHILGYNIDFNNPALKKTLTDIKLWRARRNDEMMKALNNLGYEITIDELFAVSDGNYIGKPTFAKVMIEKGYVKDVNEAFSRVFDKEESLKGLAKQTLRSKDVIDLIHEAGGIAILAHPMEQIRKDEKPEDFYKRVLVIMKKFIEYGIDGIECSHPSASESETAALRQFAAEHKLIATSGSDFHSDKIQRSYR